MTDSNPVLSSFIENVTEHQAVWGLQDETGEGWVVCDSSEFDETDVMPLWSTPEQAKQHCTEEWQDYQVAAIPLEELLEYWIQDLHDDGVLVGVDWQADQDCLELDPITLAKHLVDIEQV
ncbi:DUF2750 domain-containing protein [Shewanella sp. Isolate11]|uniref:DUF2750 domain-containing protein n=1 Tax=Shewanella sp. Isolate11 TaxID=2908530 RepID=UPI001EFEA888|nr:DUF2750 domain-containing protein [Shewanella sp. Isolate11]MCG9696798.1 DUF2750 domain-containing protein [Shewanella sp. Isolate11]